MSLQNQHNSVTLADSQILKIVGYFRRIAGHIMECKRTLFSILGDMKHCPFVRTFLCQFIYYIISEVKIIVIDKFNVF